MTACHVRHHMGLNGGVGGMNHNYMLEKHLYPSVMLLLLTHFDNFHRKGQKHSAYIKTQVSEHKNRVYVIMEGRNRAWKRGSGAPSGWETSLHTNAPQLQWTSSNLSSLLQDNVELMHCLFSPEDSVGVVLVTQAVFICRHLGPEWREERRLLWEFSSVFSPPSVQQLTFLVDVCSVCFPWVQFKWLLWLEFTFDYFIVSN